MKTKRILVPCVFLLFISCSSFRTGRIPAPAEKASRKTERIHINAEIWGVYLFQAVPIWSGSSFKTGGTTMFKTTAKIEHVMKIIEREAEKLGPGRITSVSSAVKSNWIPYSGLFWYREVQISATFDKKVQK